MMIMVGFLFRFQVKEIQLVTTTFTIVMQLAMIMDTMVVV